MFVFYFSDDDDKLEAVVTDWVMLEFGATTLVVQIPNRDKCEMSFIGEARI